MTRLLRCKNVFGKIIKFELSTKVFPKFDSECFIDSEIHSSKTETGVSICTKKNYSPLCHVTVAVKAGSKYETPENYGISSLLRASVGLSTKDKTAFNIVRSIQQFGGCLHVTSNREYISYTLTMLKEYIYNGLHFLNSSVCNQAFKPWEIEKQNSYLELERKLMKQNTHFYLLELLHSAAYRSKTLGNSTISPSYMIGNHSQSMLQKFVDEHFKLGSVAITGIGIDISSLMKFASELNINSGTVLDVLAEYKGGEERKHKGGNLAHLACAVEIPGTLSSKDIIACKVLQFALSSGTRTKWGNATGVLGRAAHTVCKNLFALSSLFLNYADSNLLGFIISGDNNDINKLCKTVFSTFQDIIHNGLTEDVLNSAIKQAKSDFFSCQESDVFFTDYLTKHTLLNLECLSRTQFENEIKDISKQTIKTILSKVNIRKLSMASIGALYNVPYIDNLI